MGIVSTELWNNLGLCCFYASQFDMAISCFERALAIGGDCAADVWYNVGQVAVGVGCVALVLKKSVLCVTRGP